MAAYNTADIYTYAKSKGYLNDQGQVKDDASANAIYQAAKQYGVSADDLDKGLNAASGTAAAWIKQRNLDPLTGVAPSAGTGTSGTTTGTTPAIPPAPTPPPPPAEASGGKLPNFTTATLDGYKPPAPAPAPSDSSSPPPASAPAPATQPPGPDYAAIFKQMMDAAKASVPTPPPAAQVVAPAPVQAASATVAPTQTAGGLITSYLDPNSDLVKRARALSLEGMSERGLQSSSIAQGAGVGAAMDRAGALATNDSNIYANTNIANMNAANSVANANADRTLSAGTVNAGAQNTANLAGYNAQVGTGQAIINSQLAKDQMAFGNSLTQSNMGLQNYLDQQKMGYGSALTLDQMGYGAKLDLVKMAQQNGYDLDKMAKANGYTLDQMSAALGFDLTKMGKGQEFDLQKLAVQNGYDINKMGIALDNQIKFANAKSALDVSSQEALSTFQTQLNKSVTGTSQLAALADKYASIFASVRTDPNLTNPEDKAKALADVANDFKSNAQVIASLYGMDASEYVSKISGSSASTSGSSGSSGSTGAHNSESQTLNIPGT